VTEAPPTGPSDDREGTEAFGGLHRPAPPATWSERLAALGDAVGLGVTPMRVVAGLVVAVALGLVGYVVLRPGPADLPEESLPFADPATESGPGSAESTTTVATTVLAHAAGAVVSPGVYSLPAGSRIADLVAAAGGPAADADLNRVNLAAVVEDGQQVYVPRVGETAPGGAAGASAGGGGDGAGAGGAGDGEPIDINTATADVLDELPGVGPAIAQAIVSYRDEHGPFGSVDDLVDVPGIGDAKLAQLRDLVTV
jgi:competence protein ComEA